MYDPCNKYLLVSQIEIEVNNDLRLLLLGSDSIIGFYRMRRSIEDILCCPGVMSAITVNEESDLRSTSHQEINKILFELLWLFCAFRDFLDLPDFSW